MTTIKRLLAIGGTALLLAGLLPMVAFADHNPNHNPPGQGVGDGDHPGQGNIGNPGGTPGQGHPGNQNDPGQGAACEQRGQGVPWFCAPPTGLQDQDREDPPSPTPVSTPVDEEELEEGEELEEEEEPGAVGVLPEIVVREPAPAVGAPDVVTPPAVAPEVTEAPAAAAPPPAAAIPRPLAVSAGFGGAANEGIPTSALIWFGLALWAAAGALHLRQRLIRAG
jgi:hypothetical protein